EDKPAAFDLALDKLMAQMRRTADRKRVHRGQRSPRSLHDAAAVPPPLPTPSPVTLDGTGREEPVADGAAVSDVAVHHIAGLEVHGDGPLLVREKVHTANPMSLDQALHEMELVGHDFYLFIDAEQNLPSVVYRRRAYDYGVIRLTSASTLAEATG
ncbi:MAG: sigma 54 modulation/S30EA ribosomal C-terminal domain-containing protein, partial [Actinomycetes bacterium]